jgi:hypothetical protein
VILKVLGALISTLGVGKTLQLVSWGRMILDTWRKTKKKVLPPKGGDS